MCDDKVMLYFLYEQRLCSLAVTATASSSAPGSLPPPAAKRPMADVPLSQLSLRLLAAAGLPAGEHRVVGLLLPDCGPVVPLRCLRNLPANGPDTAYGLLVSTVSAKLPAAALLGAPERPLPGSVLDVDCESLLRLEASHAAPEYAALCAACSDASPSPFRASASRDELSRGQSQVLGSRLLHALVSEGYFRIRLPASSIFAAAVRDVTTAALGFFARGRQEKERCRRNYEYSKFVGYAPDGARQFYQVRTSREALPWPERDLQSSGEMRRSFCSLFFLLACASRAALRALCLAPELQLDFASQVQHLLEPLTAAPHDPSTAGIDSAAAAHLLWDNNRIDQHERMLAAGETLVDHLEEAREPGCESDSGLQHDAEPARQRVEARGDEGGAACDHYSVGSDVMRVYQYYRPSDAPPPRLTQAATGLHADMGLLTVSPRAAVPGLTVLHPTATRWVDVEDAAAAGAAGEGDSLFLHVFAGESLAFLSGGRVRAVAHFVDERVGLHRISSPFFLRANPHSSIRGRSVMHFLEHTAFPRRAHLSLSDNRNKQTAAKAQTAADSQRRAAAAAELAAAVAPCTSVSRWSDY